MKISVIIPLFNKKESVWRALDSVLKQTLKPLEIIVINDGSTDGSANIAREMQSEIISVYDKGNQGVSVARNYGISMAKGEWIAFLDADDEWLPEYLENLSFLAGKYPECSVVATTYFLSDSNGLKREPVLKNLPFTGTEGILNNYFVVAASSDPPLWTSALAVRKNVIERIGFPAGITSGEDLITWARLAIDNEIAYSIIPFSVFNQASSHTYKDKPNRIPQIPDYVGKELLNIYKNIRVPGLAQYISHWHKMRASIYLRLGMKRNATGEVLKSMRMNLLNLKVYTYCILLILPGSLIRRVFLKFGR
jgi:glycosyltransferase involved in cell wall biosynthesis